jgi:peptidoglycan/LPS O-acetylase OafA/YrhL
MPFNLYYGFVTFLTSFFALLFIHARSWRRYTASWGHATSLTLGWSGFTLTVYVSPPHVSLSVPHGSANVYMVPKFTSTD